MVVTAQVIQHFMMETDIISAIQKGFFRQVQILAELGADVNVRDQAADGRTALMCCALVADERWGVGLARILLERGARVGLRTYQLRLNALHFACMFGRAELVRTFLAALDFDLTAVDVLGNTALHYAAAVGRSDIVGLVADVDFRYSGGTRLLTCSNAAGLTAAKLAAKYGHVACAQLLSAQKKLRASGVGGAAGDGRPSAHETPADSAPPVIATVQDARGNASGCSGTGKGPRDETLAIVVKRPTAVVDNATDDQPSGVLAPAVSVLLEKVEAARKDASTAERTSGLAGTPATVTAVATQPTRRSKSALPAALDVGQSPLASEKATALKTRRARSAVSRSHGQQMDMDSSRMNCCFNLRRTACLCATSQGFAGDLGEVIEDCVFSRAIVNAAPIAGPSPAERNKMERYARCRSAAAAVGPTTAVVCPGQTAWTRPYNALLMPERRRPVTAAAQMTNVPLRSTNRDNTIGRELNAVAELIPRLYRTYVYQFSTSFRQPAAQLLPSPPPVPTSRLAGGEASEDDATTTVSAVPQKARSSVTSRRGDRDRTTSSRRSPTSSHSRHH